jgi:hypothetical protein
MRRAKVIDRAYQEHTLVQRQGVAHQWSEVFPECRVQPFAVCGGDHPVPLTSAVGASPRLQARHPQ